MNNVQAVILIIIIIVYQQILQLVNVMNKNVDHIYIQEFVIIVRA